MQLQQTRRKILDYLKVHGEATVDELTEVLGLNSVTVRHHLDVLRSEELVAEPVIRHRSTPGRPQYAYKLTEKSSEHFKKNYCDLAAKVIDGVRALTPPQQINAFFEDVAGRLAAEAGPQVPGETLAGRLDRAVAYLNTQGYVASWQQTDEGCLLNTCNCPYEGLVGANPELCAMDLALMDNLLGMPLERISRVVEGAKSCSYLIPFSPEAPVEPIQD